MTRARKLRARCNQTQGFALLETAVTFPLLFALMLGLIQLTYIYRGQMQLDFACFRAARAAIVRQDEPGWLEAAQRAGKEAITYYPNAKRLTIEPGPALTSGRIGAAITLEGRLPYPLKLPMAASLYNGPDFPLRTRCTLSSESGVYVE